MKEGSYLPVLIAGAWLLLSACTPSNSGGVAPPQEASPTAEVNPAPSPEPTATVEKLQGTVSIYHSWSEDKVPALVEITQGFHKKYPDVYFDVTYVPADELRTAYEAESQAGHGPALLLGPAAWGPGLFSAGYIQALDADFNSLQLSDLNAPALQSSYYQGELIGVPYRIEGVVLYRNTDIMTITADTLDELSTLAQAATQGETVGAVLERSFTFSGGDLIGLGGQIMDENGLPAFNSPAGEAWLELLRSFEAAGPTSYLSDQDLEKFEAGEAGWIIDGTWNLVELVETLGPDRVAIDPWPEVDGGRLSGFVQSDNLYLSSGLSDDRRQAALRFMEYFLSQAAQARLAEVNFIPALQSVDLTPSGYSPIIAQAMAAMKDGAAYPSLPVMDAYTQPLDLAIKRYLQEGVPAVQALEEAETAILAEMAIKTPAP